MKNIHGGGDFFTGGHFLTIAMVIAQNIHGGGDFLTGVNFSCNSPIISLVLPIDISSVSPRKLLKRSQWPPTSPIHLFISSP